MAYIPLEGGHQCCGLWEIQQYILLYGDVCLEYLEPYFLHYSLSGLFADHNHHNVPSKALLFPYHLYIGLLAFLTLALFALVLYC
jgi:hypothetical protein